MRTMLGVVVCVCVLWGSLGVQMAQATGMGAYVRTGSTSGTIDFDRAGERDVDNGSFSIGFSLDTAVGSEKVYGYKLDVGYHTLEMENAQGDTVLDVGGLELNNTFGFGLVRTRSTRIYFGPTLRFIGAVGDVRDDDSAVFISLGLGPVIGGNHNINDAISIGWAIDYLFRVGVGGTSHGDDWRDEDDWTTQENGVSGSIYLLFPFGGRR
jgi:hypothetical protein